MNTTTNGQQVAVIAPARLPYHDAIQERFGVDRGSWTALVEAVFPAAKTTKSVMMALAYCKARNLDPFKKPVHIVPMWDSRAGGYVETVWPGIAELRTTAFRTKQYAGCDEVEFGPIAKRAFTGRVKGKEGWEERTVTVEFPEWARMTVYRDLGGRVCKFVGPKVKWLEAYATIGASDIPNDMWQSRPEGQLEKCAEAAALRKAFPEELGNELTADEMAGRTLVDEPRSDAPPSRSGPPAPPAAITAPPPPPEETPVDGQVEEPERDPLDIPDYLDRRAPKKDDTIAADETEWLRELGGAFSGCELASDVIELQAKMMQPMKTKVSKEAWAKAAALVQSNMTRINQTVLDAG